LLLAAVTAPTPSAAADMFLLHQGGQVEGEWLNRAASSSEAYEIKTSLGGRIMLPKDRVAEVVSISPDAAEHARLAPTFVDTIEAQWRIAEWCRARDLTPQRETHLRRILELDPDHVKARLALGYMHIGGRWVTQDEQLHEQGYELYRGRRRLVQEIELLEQRSKRQQAENEWRARLVRWCTAATGDAQSKAWRQIAAVRDPRAVPALAEMLARDRRPALRLLYVEVLGQIGTAEAAKALVTFSVDHADVEVRWAALEEIVRLQPPAAPAAYIAMLKDADNRRVNAAATALAEVGDRTAIEPLIEALVTVHAQAVRIGGGSDAVTTSFNRDSAGGGGAGLQTGGRTEILRQAIQNQAVLQALVRLTGGPSFGFHQQAWRNWYAIEKSRLEQVDARRDSLR
jgi:hypothetical protein